MSQIPTIPPIPATPALPPRGSRPAQAPALAAEPGRTIPNPTLRLDGSLGMVVLEFYDASGAITASIPSQRVLDAYRNHTKPMPQPPGAEKADLAE